MAGAATQKKPKAPALATTYDGNSPALFERIGDVIDYIEITPDAIAQPGEIRPHVRTAVLDEYSAVAHDLHFVVHGVGLSIGSFDSWNSDYLGLVDEVFERLTIEWHSEHLACTTVAGENLGTMFAMPRTREALDLVCERVTRIQARYRVPFLLEHVIRLLPEPEAEFTDAAFLNELTARTGCGLILDAYNLECDRKNFGFSIPAFLAELNLDPVYELHVAGGVQHKGFQLDIHSTPASDETLEIALDIIAHAPNLRAVTFEFLNEAIPALGHDGIRAELQRLGSAIA
jgi:uncharacterized protein (UPF0276 family)